MSKFKVGDRVRLCPSSGLRNSYPGEYVVQRALDAHVYLNTKSLGELWGVGHLELVTPLPTGITVTVQHETVQKPVSVTVVIPYEDAIAFVNPGCSGVSCGHYESEKRLIATIREALK